MAPVNNTASDFRRLGEAARLAHEAVHAAFRAGVRGRDPEAYHRLLAVFRAANTAALPSEDRTFFPALARGAPRHVEAAIAFLEADPWFFRSGYEKQNLIRHVKRAKLTASQRQRLGGVVVAAVDGRDRTEFRHYCRLACGVWSDWLDDQIAERMRSPDPGIRRRAIWVAGAAISAGKA